MKTFITLIGLMLLLQGCASNQRHYSEYDNVYYGDDYNAQDGEYYANDYYADGSGEYYLDNNYDNDAYANNYYPDRWGVNYSDVYYSPYRYPRVSFYNHYSYYPNSYWGSYSPWGLGLGYSSYYNGFSGWSFGLGYGLGYGYGYPYYGNYGYYNHYTNYYYNSYWNNYWNRYSTRRHIQARSEVARIAAGNRYGNRPYNNYRNNSNADNPRGRTTGGHSSTRTPTTRQPFSLNNNGNTVSTRTRDTRVVTDHSVNQPNRLNSAGTNTDRNNRNTVSTYRKPVTNTGYTNVGNNTVVQKPIQTQIQTRQTSINPES